MLLVLVVALGAAAAVMFAESFRRQDSLRGLAGMTIMIVAGMIAALYGALDS